MDALRKGRKAIETGCPQALQREPVVGTSGVISAVLASPDQNSETHAVHVEGHVEAICVERGIPGNRDAS